MAKKAKDRRIIVRLVSTALTGIFYSVSKLRTAPKMSLMKYDKRVNRHVLFLEAKRSSN